MSMDNYVINKIFNIVIISNQNYISNNFTQPVETDLPRRVIYLEVRLPIKDGQKLAEDVGRI